MSHGDSVDFWSFGDASLFIETEKVHLFFSEHGKCQFQRLYGMLIDPNRDD